MKMSNAAIITTGIAISLVFISMCVYMVWYGKTHKIEMFNNSYNSYSARLSKEYIRGSIYSSDNEVLAYSEGTTVEDQKRVYPYGNMFAHSVGYSTNGKMGVESAANYYLLNCHMAVSDKAKVGRAHLNATADSVYTTLDTRLQQVAYDSLGVYKGAVIITEVKTGRILTMVSKPDFDPNQIDVIWEDMLNDKDNSALLNRVTQGQYPPGSTFKIVTALEYLRENNNVYDGYHFNCNGSLTYEDTTIHCFHSTAHGSLNFDTSFANSCNSSFANIGLGLDRASFAKTLDDLLFEQELPYDLPSSVSHTNINENTDSHDLMQASIGQGQDSLSPLHLNMITCAVANGGAFIKPHLLDRIESTSGNIVEKFDEKESIRIMTEEESAILTELMRGVIDHGTGKRLKDAGYTSAGKTGSAEFSNRTKGDSHAWFTGFAPVEDPQIAVTIIIEGAGNGGEYAVPLAKRMFDAWLE